MKKLGICEQREPGHNRGRHLKGSTCISWHPADSAPRRKTHRLAIPTKGKLRGELEGKFCTEIMRQQRDKLSLREVRDLGAELARIATNSSPLEDLIVPEPPKESIQ